jgi:trigger factor
MTLKVDVQTVDALRRRLDVEVPAEEVSAEIERTYAQLARSVKVPGFRPGRAPRPVLERLFGDRVRAEVFERLIQQSYTEAIEGQQIAVVGRPEIVTEQAEPGAALRYNATVEVKPDVVADRYEGLEVERPIVTVTDADVDAFMERLRQSFAQLRPITDRTNVEVGDVVTLDYEARVEARVVGRAENREVEIGANGFPPEFDQQLLGAAVGADLNFEIAYPADRGGPDVAGKTLLFHVHVRALSRKEVPALDDEFAKDHGECSTLEELRQRARQRLETEATQHADDMMRQNLLDALAKVHDIPVPTAMVHRRTEALVEEVWHEWQQQRIRPRNEAEARERLHSDLEPRAQQQVKIALLLEAIARQEGISVSDDEVEARVAAMATEAGTAAERLQAFYRDANARRDLGARMLQARAVDIVAKRAKVTTVERSTSVAEAKENG